MSEVKFEYSDHLEIIGVKGIPEIRAGDGLTAILFDALEKNDLRLESGDAIVFTSKIISKSEGRVVDLVEVKAGNEAERIAAETDKDPRIVQLILNEIREIVIVKQNNIIVETKHGFVCANAGVDESNVEEGKAVLLPEDPQSSVSQLRQEIEARSGKEVSVLTSDSFGRAFRDGVSGICVGVSGVPALLDRRGERDRFGMVAMITKEAIADEVCAAANLVMGEFNEGIPVAIVRGLRLKQRDSNIEDVLFHRANDLFR